MARRVGAEAGDALAADDHAAADRAAPDQVVEHEHAGQHAGARVRDVEAGRAGARRSPA